MDIKGYCDPAFAGVREEFERNFAERGDVGASACVIVDGVEVVNLWGGVANPTTGEPWEAHTVTTIMSATKGATALCAHILADRGELDIDAPVSQYWPEFAAKGKESVTVRMALNHQSGIPSFRAPVPEGRYCDWEYMVQRIADEAPHWTPGTRVAYHALTFGWLVGEVVRRVSGKSLGAFFREEVGDPLDLDFWIGLPQSEHYRVAPLRKDPEDPLLEAIANDPDGQSPLSRAFQNDGGFLAAGGWNSPEVYQAEIYAANGMANARGLARMYAPLSLDGCFEGHQIISPETVARMGIVDSAVLSEETIGMPARLTLGYFKEGTEFGLPESVFGHGGWGGAMGLADPQARLAFGYAMNQMSSTPRFEALTMAAYTAIGYRPGKYGLWMRD